MAGLVKIPVVMIGVAGCALIEAPKDGAEEQPSELVTVKVGVEEAANPLKVAVAEEPVIVPPVEAVTVQLPEGRLLRFTLPVPIEQVGCTIELMVRVDGVTG